jgi:UDP-N-acetylmuramoyl-L-alanyl-D-glutamate--2,6-diaminopimelate ligase
MFNLGAAAAAVGVSVSPEHAKIEIAGITLDSRRVQKGDLFFALPGVADDGAQYAAEAAAKGAVAILTEKREPLTALPQLIVGDARMAAAVVAKSFYRQPDKALRIGAVTGTNGKTTTAWLVRRLLNASGVRCGLLGTIEYDLGDRVIPAPLTTPDAPELFSHLRAMADAGCRAAFMEFSSHSLVQKRTAGLAPAVAVFTNLTQDHLDYHRTMDEYRAAKGLLFESLPAEATAVLNANDPASDFYAARTEARVLRFALAAAADLQAEIVRHDLAGTSFLLRTPWGERKIHWSPIGRHNVENALGALAAAMVMGADFDAACAALESFTGVPGRLECVGPDWGGKKADLPSPTFRVMVDYAHTDDALRSVLRALREARPNRLLCVFGCGGDRDRSKRPKMGRAAEEEADLVVLTSDNPRTENPAVIIDEVLKGVRHPQRFCVEPDREAAIKLAVNEAREGDIVLLAGKGHENYQIMGKEKRPFDDRLCAREALIARLRIQPNL